MNTSAPQRAQGGEAPSIDDQERTRHAEHDHRGKLILEQAADYLGDTHREEEVPSPDGQRMDLWFIRRQVTEALPGFMLLLDEMLRDDTMIDLFSQTLCVKCASAGQTANTRGWPARAGTAHIQHRQAP